MFDWNNWSVEFVVAIFFITGFSAFYNAISLWLRQRFESKHQGQAYARVGLLLFTLIMVLFCQVAEFWNPINSDAYMNWALYVLFIPLLDEAVAPLEFVIRAIGIGGFWLFNGTVTASVFWLSLFMVIIILALTGYMHRTLDRAHPLTVAIAVWFAIAFWITQTQLMLINLVMGVVMFASMNLFAAMYWSIGQKAQRERTRLIEQVNRDTLTNAGSVFAFQDDGRNLLPRIRESGEPLSLAMFDIDHFKQVNDKYGHAMGNYVLQEVTALITQIIHEGCVDQSELYRTGGEEFNIIFLNADVSTITPVIADILNEVRQHAFEFEGQRVQITLSMGVTQVQAADAGFEDIYERADKYLYISKQEGRDCATLEGKTVTML